MRTKNWARLAFLLVLVLLLVPIGLQGSTGVNDVTTSGESDRIGTNGSSITGPRDNATVVTTSPRKNSNASIIGIAADGTVLYYNETHKKYFDVDPVRGTEATIEYVAEGTEGNCEPQVKRCGSIVIERVNLSTGEVSRVHTFTEYKRADWHDVDRIGDDKLLIADINDRIFIFNTSTELITWQYEFRTDFDPESGGVYPSDWTHLNDVEYLSDGTIMASPRNHDQVVFIDKEEGLLSNRTLGSDGAHDILYEQHNPDYIPDNRGGPAAIVADSQNNRIVEYQRVDDNWKLSWKWTDAKMQWPRDADRLPNGHTLITDSNSNRVFEIDQNGSIVWTLNVDTPYEAERLGTGDESKGGHSANELGLANRSAGIGDSASSIQDQSQTENSRTQFDLRGILLNSIKSVMSLLPNLIVNAVLFVLPAWVGIIDLFFIIVSLILLVTWGLVELRWSDYSLAVKVEKSG